MSARRLLTTWLMWHGPCKGRRNILLNFSAVRRGCIFQYIVDEERDGRARGSGQNGALALEELLERFVQRYVLCGHCLAGEMEIDVMRKGTVIAQCSFCGVYGDLDKSDCLTATINKKPTCSAWPL